MDVFRRRRRTEKGTGRPDEGTEATEVTDAMESSAARAAGAPDADSADAYLARGAGPRADGPFDVSEVADPGQGGRVDLGGLWLPGKPGMELRVEVDQQTQAIASIAAVIGKAAVQVQAFAAPRSEGLWHDIRGEIAHGIAGQGGRTEEVEGPFGTELRAHIPVKLPDGTAGAQVVRFAGVDGPRWFLRGVFSGEAVADPEAAAPLEEVFRGIVVVRGGHAMAPREPIPLRLPPQVQPQQAPGQPTQAARPPLSPFERGPEITEVR